MKLVRLVSELDFGGVEQVLATAAESLRESSEVDVEIIVLGRGGRIADQLIRQGFQVHILNSSVRIPNLSLVFRLVQLLKTIRPNVVHTQGAEANFHGIWAARLAGVRKIIGEEIGIPNHHSYWKWIFRWLYQKADRVIAISQTVKRHLLQLKELEEDKISVVYNPISSFLNQPVAGSDRSSSSFNWITIARLVPIKNLDRLMQVFANLVELCPDQVITLEIVGDGPERAKLEDLAKNLGIASQVKFLGYQSEVFPYLFEADAFVLPSLSEGSSVALAEAMAAGLPSVVTAVGGAAEIVGESKSALFIDPEDQDAIQTAMLQIMNLNRAERTQWGEMAMQEAKRFDRMEHARNLMVIYQS
jgi:glycosyltransferase involved in cell wall biosynthesis